MNDFIINRLRQQGYPEQAICEYKKYAEERDKKYLRAKKHLFLGFGLIYYKNMFEIWIKMRIYFIKQFLAKKGLFVSNKDKKSTFKEQMQKAAKIVVDALKKAGEPPPDDSFGSKNTNTPKKKE